MGCDFTVLAFPGAGDAAEPEVAYTENIIGFILQDDSDQVTRFQRIYDAVWGRSMGAEASVDTMRQAQSQLTT
ncbi:Scr1 family TA system antitoxin-like transcriptional regulator [Actinophytocola sp.]|uniref:Scr1 family TA system antitoxin-like transcriptional regulator n=1 Tax=Actinophytocola sp. TaxID=1872138 RepID=UPI002ED967F6